VVVAIKGVIVLFCKEEEIIMFLAISTACCFWIEVREVSRELSMVEMRFLRVFWVRERGWSCLGVVRVIICWSCCLGWGWD